MKVLEEGDKSLLRTPSILLAGGITFAEAAGNHSAHRLVRY